MLQLGDTAKAKQDVDAALVSQPGSVPGIYMRAVLLARAQDWRGTDEALQRIGGGTWGGCVYDVDAIVAALTR